jgi:hypothetical protein
LSTLSLVSCSTRRSRVEAKMTTSHRMSDRYGWCWLINQMLR